MYRGRSDCRGGRRDRQAMNSVAAAAHSPETHNHHEGWTSAARNAVRRPMRQVAVAATGPAVRVRERYRMKLSFLLWLASVLPQPAADQLCLATTVYLEARSESQIGQMAVAEVAMRRRENGRWGDTVCEVVRA